ncbi:coronin-2B-like [Hypomesus transpacificus]|uniref:coronin-2B-like n=1 Tax=Hypomesus transpacificus TaxID=137520 RepID=UPI001F076D2C|nr:coronin-2B-like [Hypomesus transpacificus]
MSWCSSCHGSKFRHVFGKAAGRDHAYDGVPITRSVHDNHYCSVNPLFIAVVTECAGGGAFLVLPVHHKGRVPPLQPRVSGHTSRVLDVKWNPFDDLCIASCSEDCTVKIWDIPSQGVQQNITVARKTLIGHSKRVGLIEWHPTARDLLVSSAYDYKVMVWDVSQDGRVLRPVRQLQTPELLLSVSLSRDGRWLACCCRDRRLRVLEPRSGRILQESGRTSHRASKVLYAGDQLVSTGTSCWNQRQVAVWDPEDLSEPLLEEELDGSSGVLFPFYDPDTHMLYLAGKGDGNIRYYELSSEKPYLHYLTEYRSLLPQRGLGVMPKRGLDVRGCEVFRFYRLIIEKHLVEPLSMIVPRKQVGVFQEDLYPMTAGDQAAMTAQEWLSGNNRGPLLMSLKPGARVTNPYPERAPERGQGRPLEQAFLQEQLAYQDAKYPQDLSDLSGWQPDETQAPGWAYPQCTPHCCEPSEQAPPPAERELLQDFYRQQDEIRELQEQLNQKQVRITQLELEGKNNRNKMRATF